MARLPRLYVADQPQYVLLRTALETPAFRDEADFSEFRDSLRLASRETGLALHAYVLLPGAVRLLATPKDSTCLSRAIQSLGRRYVTYFNQRYQSEGPLWAGRFRATVIQPEKYLLLASGVLESMPVGEQLSATPVAYRWSSHAHHVGRSIDPLITDHALYWALGNTPFERQRAYRDFVEQGFPSASVAALEEAAAKGWVLGDAAFLERCMREANRRIAPLKRGRRPRVAKTGADQD